MASTRAPWTRTTTTTNPPNPSSQATVAARSNAPSIHKASTLSTTATTTSTTGITNSTSAHSLPPSSSSQSNIMSTTTSPSDSPNVQPLHGQAATIQFPQAPLGNANAILNVQMNANAQNAQANGLTLGAKALLAKKMAKSGKAFNSPTDNMLTPCSAKLNQTKKKHFVKAKSVPKLFATPASEAGTPSTEESTQASQATDETSATTVFSEEDVEKADTVTDELDQDQPMDMEMDTSDIIITLDAAEDKENEKPLPALPIEVDVNPFLV